MFGELVEASFGIFESDESYKASFRMLELGEASFGMFKLGGLGGASFGMFNLGELGVARLIIMKLNLVTPLRKLSKNHFQSRHQLPRHLISWASILFLGHLISQASNIMGINLWASNLWASNFLGI